MFLGCNNAIRWPRVGRMVTLRERVPHRSRSSREGVRRRRRDPRSMFFRQRCRRQYVRASHPLSIAPQTPYRPLLGNAIITRTGPCRGCFFNGLAQFFSLTLPRHWVTTNTSYFSLITEKTTTLSIWLNKFGFIFSPKSSYTMAEENAPATAAADTPATGDKQEKPATETIEQPKAEGNGKAAAAATEEPPKPEMKAVVLTGFGGLKSVKILKKPEPSLGEGEVIIRVKAWWVNLETTYNFISVTVVASVYVWNPNIWSRKVSSYLHIGFSPFTHLIKIDHFTTVFAGEYNFNKIAVVFIRCVFYCHIHWWWARTRLINRAWTFFTSLQYVVFRYNIFSRFTSHVFVETTTKTCCSRTIFWRPPQVRRVPHTSKSVCRRGEIISSRDSSARTSPSFSHETKHDRYYYFICYMLDVGGDSPFSAANHRHRHPSRPTHGSSCPRRHVLPPVICIRTFYLSFFFYLYSRPFILRCVHTHSGELWILNKYFFRLQFFEKIIKRTCWW